MMLCTKSLIPFKLLACEAGRKYKAWGASPRIRSPKYGPKPVKGRQSEIYRLSPAVAGSNSLLDINLGLAPRGFMLASASQAKTFCAKPFDEENRVFVYGKPRLRGQLFESLQPPRFESRL